MGRRARWVVLLLCLAVLSARALPAAGEYRGSASLRPSGPGRCSGIAPRGLRRGRGAEVPVRVPTPAPGRGGGHSGGGHPVLWPRLWGAWGQRRARRGAEAAERSCAEGERGSCQLPARGCRDPAGLSFATGAAPRAWWGQTHCSVRCLPLNSSLGAHLVVLALHKTEVRRFFTLECILSPRR